MTTNTARALAAALNARIQERVGEGESWPELVAAMAIGAGVDAPIVNQVLQGEAEAPPLEQLAGFADALNMPLEQLIAAAEKDGSSYGEAGNMAQKILAAAVNTVMKILAPASPVPAMRERAVSTSQIWEQLWMELERRAANTGYYFYPVDIFYEDDQIFAVVAAKGQLYRMDAIVTEGAVTFGQPQPVVQQFTPVGESATERSRTTVIRQADGRYRFIDSMCTATINRVNEIDSRLLFDHMIRRAEDSGRYPYRTFNHEGTVLRTGQYDRLWRIDNVYIGSGLYDEDSEFAEIERQAITNAPDRWGTSIGYLPLAREMLTFEGGIRIPVYTDGEHMETSVLRESRAASLFTGTAVLTEVQRMADLKKSSQEEIIQLFLDAGKTEADARAFLSRNVDGVNREIAEQGLVTRNGEGDGAAAGTEGGDQPVQPDPQTPNLASGGDIEITPELEEAIARQAAGLINRANAQAVEDLKAETVRLREELRQQSAANTQYRQAVEARLAKLERGRAEELEELAVTNAPELATRHKVVRASQERQPAAETPKGANGAPLPQPGKFDEAAQSVTAKMRARRAA
jgi:hypothetical protein